jgi:glycosyltransferase involved in cell wall biosynthesis
MVRAPHERGALRRAIRALRPDVIHLHNPYPSFGPEVHIAAAAAGVPLVVTVHNFRLRCPNGLLYTEGSPCRRCVGGRYDQAIRHACFPTRAQAAAYASALWIHRFVLHVDADIGLYIAPSRFMRSRLVEWGIPAERTTVVRNFTVPPASAPPLGDRGLYLGRLSMEKGVSTLLEALKLAGDPPFDIVGGGPDAASVAATASSLGLRRTRLVGSVVSADVPRIIEDARYAVIPSIWDENAPLAALESMAAGRPIVASNVGGLPELAEDGRGRLVRPGDARSLAEAIEGYVGDPLAVEEDGDRARVFVVGECSPGVHREALERAYASAIARARHGQSSRIAGGRPGE